MHLYLHGLLRPRYGSSCGRLFVPCLVPFRARIGLLTACHSPAVWRRSVRRSRGRGGKVARAATDIGIDQDAHLDLARSPYMLSRLIASSERGGVSGNHFADSIHAGPEIPRLFARMTRARSGAEATIGASLFQAAHSAGIFSQGGARNSEKLGPVPSAGAEFRDYLPGR